jgi:hypothetical protein
MHSISSNSVIEQEDHFKLLLLLHEVHTNSCCSAAASSYKSTADQLNTVLQAVVMTVET